MSKYKLKKNSPIIDKSVFIADSANVIGKVTLRDKSSVWFNTVIRGDSEFITIGSETNIQDLCVCHADPGSPLIVGDRVTVGHKVILHGCIIEDDCLIGMGAIIMNGAKIGKGSVVGAGAVILENSVFDDYSLIIGNPATLKKTYPNTIVQLIHKSSETYVEKAKAYKNELEKL